MKGKYHVDFKPKCLNELERFAPLEETDLVFAELYELMSRSPHDFKRVEAHPNWHIATTELHQRRGRAIPPLRFLFTVDDEQLRVNVFGVGIDPDNPIWKM